MLPLGNSKLIAKYHGNCVRKVRISNGMLVSQNSEMCVLPLDTVNDCCHLTFHRLQTSFSSEKWKASHQTSSSIFPEFFEKPDLSAGRAPQRNPP